MSIITLDRVSHSFEGYWALKDISFSLEEGEFLFLTGPSGAGKTSLLRLLYGDLPLMRGSAMVAGFNLRERSNRTLPLLRRQLGVVFQDFKILPERTVYDNVAIALEVRGLRRETIDRRVRAVLRGLNLDTRSDAACSSLSGGEQQRVAIARAVVVNPRLLLADEPSGNLDPKLSLRIMDIFRQFNAHGTAVILATHSPDLLAAFPGARILALDQGVIAAPQATVPHPSAPRQAASRQASPQQAPCPPGPTQEPALDASTQAMPAKNGQAAASAGPEPGTQAPVAAAAPSEPEPTATPLPTTRE